MDIRMPGVDGIEATRRIAARPDLASVHVVILTTFELDEYVFEGLRAGAAGFLVKDTDAAELIRAVRIGASGEAILTPAVTRRLIAEFALRTRSPWHAPSGRADPPGARSARPDRHRAVQRRDLPEIYISPATVKTDASRAMTKLGARDRAQLSSWPARPALSGRAERTYLRERRRSGFAAAASRAWSSSAGAFRRTATDNVSGRRRGRNPQVALLPSIQRQSTGTYSSAAGP